MKWRCFDCLDEMPGEASQFAVLKQMREDKALPPEFWSFLWDPVFVCQDCAGWYGDHAINIGAYEERQA